MHAVWVVGGCRVVVGAGVWLPGYVRSTYVDVDAV